MSAVDISFFQAHTGITLSDDETARVSVLLDRARRAVNAEINLPSQLEGDELLDYRDAVAEVAWYYWEAEKAGVMEILAMPVIQLSIGGLFWTKDTHLGDSFGAASDGLYCLRRVIQKWGLRNRTKIRLEGELEYE